MKRQRSRWIYVVLVVLILALIGFSTLPLVSSILRENQFLARRSSTASAGERSQLETEAAGYQLVLNREPNNQTALKGLLEVRLQQGDLEGAIAPLEKIAQLNPDRTDYTILLAQAKQQIGDLEEASIAYRSILSSDPGNLKALSGLSELFLSQKRPEAAIGLVQDALKKVKSEDSLDLPSVQLLLGGIYAEEKRYSEAIAIYDEAIEANREDFRPVLAKALVLQEQGKKEEARSFFETALSLAPANYKDQVRQIIDNTPKGDSSNNPN